MENAIIPTLISCIGRVSWAAGFLAVALGSGQTPQSAEFRYLYTFGSKDGIHPPRILNRKLARAVVGDDEHPYGLTFPVGVTTDPRHRVWITDSGTASVHIFDRESGAYREIRRAGDYPLQQPAGIMTDAGGRVYFADSGSGGIFVFDEKGEYDRALVKPGSRLLERPSAMALSADQRTIYVVDPPRNLVVALNREGEVNGSIQLPAELDDPSSVAVVNNQVYVLGRQRHRVAGFRPNGTPLGPLNWEGVEYPTAFAFEAERGLYFVANPRFGSVQVFTPEGLNIGVFGQRGDRTDQMREVEGLYVDPQELVYVVDSHQGKVLVFASSAQP